jgi:hypothetical protein
LKELPSQLVVEDANPGLGSKPVQKWFSVLIPPSEVVRRDPWQVVVVVDIQRQTVSFLLHGLDVLVAASGELVGRPVDALRPELLAYGVGPPHEAQEGVIPQPCDGGHRPVAERREPPGARGRPWPWTEQGKRETV